MGGVAVTLNGARSYASAVEVLLTRQGLYQLRENTGSAFEQVPGRLRRFVDRKNRIAVEVKVAGHFPGMTSPGPFTFPDPRKASEERARLCVLTMPLLIQYCLADKRFSSLADVVFLITAHQLNESFLDKLSPAVHRGYLACLEEMRREKEFVAREA
jgi:hypothetical protein